MRPLLNQVVASGKNSAVLKKEEFTTWYGWLAGWLVGWFVGLLVCWFVGLLVCWLVGWLVGLLVGWFVGWLLFDPSDFWAKWSQLERAVHFSKKFAICDKKRCARLSQAHLW